jgi:hypothetical protein
VCFRDADHVARHERGADELRRGRYPGGCQVAEHGPSRGVAGERIRRRIEGRERLVVPQVPGRLLCRVGEQLDLGLREADTTASEDSEDERHVEKEYVPRIEANQVIVFAKDSVERCPSTIHPIDLKRISTLVIS